MRAVVRPAAYVLSDLSLRWYRNPKRFAVIAAHARSGSSLLSHLLKAHPDFAGCVESFTEYGRPEDRRVLHRKICRENWRPWVREPWLFDKANHLQFFPPAALDTMQPDRLVLLLREPVRSLESMVSYFGRHRPEGFPEERAVRYYERRLEELLVLAEKADAGGIPILILEYDFLVEHRQEALTALTEFFGLLEPFRDHYSTDRLQGETGDQSANIFKGTVGRTPRHEASLSQAVLRRGEKAFACARTALRTNNGRVLLSEMKTSKGFADTKGQFDAEPRWMERRGDS